MSGAITRLFLSSHPDDGIPVGDKWEQTLWHCLRQSGAVIVLCTANWLASPWCVAEAMIARERGKRVFLLATAEVADGRQVKAATTRAAPIPGLSQRHAVHQPSRTSRKTKPTSRCWRGLEKEG